MKRASINWEQVHARVRLNESALQDALAPNPRRIEEAYRERAIRLANQLTQLNPGTPALIFLLGEERYAIELKDVAEVLQCDRCTPVPGAPAEFLGIMSVRGELRSVLDLSAVLGISRRDSSASGFVLMLRYQGQGIGVKVDAIEELRDIRPEETTPTGQGRFVKGFVSGKLFLLDTERMLAHVVSQEES